MDADLMPDFEAQCRAERAEDKVQEFVIVVTETRTYRVKASGKNQDEAEDMAIYDLQYRANPKTPDRVDWEVETKERIV